MAGFRSVWHHILAWSKRAINSRWFLRSAVVGVFAFAAARALAAWPVLAPYGVNLWVFLAIDLVTSPPYVYCINGFIRSIRADAAGKTVLNGLGIAGSFAAPYVYIYWVGGPAMPTTAIVILAVIILAFLILGPVRKIVTTLRAVR